MGTHYSGTAKDILALNTFIRFSRASETLNSRLNRHLKDLGLTVSQLGILETLLHLGPMCQREVGDKLLKSRANVTTVVDNLEKQGLVQRVSAPEDRRMQQLHLTAKGKALIERAFPLHKDVIVSCMGTLTPEEQKTFGQLCKKLGMANLEQEVELKSA